MKDIFQNLINIGKSLVPVIEAVAGTTFLGPAITAGQAVIGLIDGVKESSGETPAELDETRDALEEAVNAHVDQTISDLRGE